MKRGEELNVEIDDLKEEIKRIFIRMEDLNTNKASILDSVEVNKKITMKYSSMVEDLKMKSIQESEFVSLKKKREEVEREMI
jgi:hypothetical protein